MISKINIGIAEDHGLVRQGFIRMLRDYSNINILFEAANGKELLRLLKDFKPDVILLDIAMPVLGGLKSIEKIKQRYPRLKIIVISAYSEETSVIEYVKLGANAFLNKDCTVNQLVDAIHSVNNNGSYFDEATSKLLLKHGLLPNNQTNKRELTEREIIILKLLCANKPLSEIASLMGLAEKTVNWYKFQLMQKTNSKDQEELVSYAEKNQLV